MSHAGSRECGSIIGRHMLHSRRQQQPPPFAMRGFGHGGVDWVGSERSYERSPAWAMAGCPSTTLDGSK